MNTKIRSSQQLIVDDHLDHNSKKIINLADGTANTDGVSKGQMDTAINNAVSGLGNSIHVPVADITAAVAVVAAQRADKMLMLIETLGLYHYDAESLAVTNATTIIRPTDIASDVTAGRWIKMSSILTDHALLDNILGNGGYHLSLAERDKLTGIAANADVTSATNVGAAIHGATAKTTMVDADEVAIIDSAASNVLKRITWANLKATLVTYFNTLYNNYVHPNHSGDVTSAGDGAQTIAANAVTNAKAAQMATHTIKGNNTAATANALDLSMAQLAVLLDDLTQWIATAEIADKAVTAAKIADATVTATQLAAKAVTLAKMDDMATASFIGRNTAATGVPEVLPIATVKTMLGLTISNQATRKYRVTPTGTINGSNTAFTIPDLILTGTEEIYKNGILMNAGAGNDYTIAYAATSTITFATAPNSNGFTDVILVNYSV